MAKRRLLSGIKPTGRLHLGNYLGAVSNWVRLQDEFDCFFMIADYHALTSVYEDPKQLRQDKLELAIDLLSLGVDPQKSCLFFQSDVMEHAELHLLLSMMTPLSWLERVPTYKSTLQSSASKDLSTYGFLGYPVLQAADIMLYKAEAVPVGKDQLPHLELTREIIRRFNHLYGHVFPEPTDYLTDTTALPGLDGQKMSKSYGNTIPVTSSEEELRALAMKMSSDPARVRLTDPGNPDLCTVYTYHQLFNEWHRVEAIEKGCREASLGCAACKKECGALLVSLLQEFRATRHYFEAHLDEVHGILELGAAHARTVAKETLQHVRYHVGL